MIWGCDYYPAQNEAAQTLSRGRGDARGAWMASGCDALAGLRHHGPQLLAGLEDRHRSRGDFHRITGARISMLCCSDSAALTASRKESTTRAQSFLEIRGPAVRAICAVTFSTRSAFVIHPP